MLIKRCSWGSCSSDSRFGDDGDRPVPEMKGVKFYPMPDPKTDLKKCKRWVKSCGRKSFTVEHVGENSFICSKHFKDGGPTEKDPDPLPLHEQKVGVRSYTNIDAPLHPVKISNSKCQDLSVINIEKSLICVSCRSHFETMSDMYSHIKSTVVCNKWYNSNPQLMQDIASKVPQRKRPLCILFRAIEKKDGVRSPKRFLNVDEYFYARTLGNKTYKRKAGSKIYSCYSCGKNLKSNVRFMSHARHKVLNVWEKRDKEENKNTCVHCYRKFDTDFERQCHVELVHLVDNDKSQAQTVCKICDLHFTTEHGFLQHMKTTHFRKETPYLCHVCNYRSSCYSDVIQHFKQEHDNTGFLQCCFCLQVRDAQNKFLTHTITHVKDCVHCTKCRLLFVSKDDLQVHLNRDHGSNAAAIKGDNLNSIEVYVHINNSERLKTIDKPQPTRSAQSASSVKTDLEPFVKKPKMSNILPTNFTDDMLLSRPNPKSSPYDPCVTKDFIEKVRIKRNRDPTFNGCYDCMECTNFIGCRAEDFLNHFHSFYECTFCTYVSACKHACLNHIEQKHADPDYAFKEFESSDDEEFMGFGEKQPQKGGKGAQVRSKKKVEPVQECEPDSTNQLLKNEEIDVVTTKEIQIEPQKQSQSVQTVQPAQTNRTVTAIKVPLHVPVLIPPTTTYLVVKQKPTVQNTLPASTSLTSIPKKPTFIKFSHITATTVVVEWGRPRSSVITQYRILFQGSRAQICKQLPPNRTVVRLIDLTADTKYNVEVYAVNGLISSQAVKGQFSTRAEITKGTIILNKIANALGSATVKKTDSSLPKSDSHPQIKTLGVEISQSRAIVNDDSSIIFKDDKLPQDNVTQSSSTNQDAKEQAETIRPGEATRLEVEKDSPPEISQTETESPTALDHESNELSQNTENDIDEIDNNDAGQVNIVSSSDAITETNEKNQVESNESVGKSNVDGNLNQFCDSKNESDEKLPTLEDFKIAMSEDVF